MNRSPERIEMIFNSSARGLQEPGKAQLEVRWPASGLLTWVLGPEEEVRLPAGARIERIITPTVFDDGFASEITVGHTS